jgi:hypothetical protein
LLRCHDVIRAESSKPMAFICAVTWFARSPATAPGS